MKKKVAVLAHKLERSYQKRWVVASTAVVLAAAVTASLIYLTPLKWLNVVPPVMHEADPAEFNAAFTAHPDEYVFIDVRTADVYGTSHAKGSIDIPVKYLSLADKTLPRSGKKIALICTDGMLAAIAYGYLQSQGFTNLVHIEGGLQSWVYEGLPVEGSSGTLSANSR